MLSYAGILVAMVFLLAINTELFSLNACEEDCHTGQEACLSCYVYGDTPTGNCENGPNDPEKERYCVEGKEPLTCATEHMFFCCGRDEKHCDKGKEYREETEYIKCRKGLEK